MKASVLEFRLRDELYCFNTQHIAYVFELEEYTPIDEPSSAVLGIVRYNDDMMPLVDTLYLYSKEHLASTEYKSVVVIYDEQKNIYGMLVDEIIKIEELDLVHPSVDINTEELVINHYKDKQQLVNEIFPLPLLKKEQILTMHQHNNSLAQDEMNNTIHTTQEYLLFTIGEKEYALGSEYVKEVLHDTPQIFYRMSADQRLCGAIAVRDEVISIANIQQPKEIGSVIIAEHETKEFAILVDEVYDIEHFETGKIEYTKSKEESVAGFYNFKNEVIALINPHFYLQSVVEKELHHLQEQTFSTKDEYLTFYLGTKRFAIDMQYVRQVVESDLLAKTESSSIISSPDIRFITTWNKHAVSVADISTKLGVRDAKKLEQTLFLSFDNKIVAFLIDDVDDIVYIKADSVKHVDNSDSIVGGALMVDGDVVIKLNERYLVQKL